MKEEFRGFVRKIRPKIPLEIECEDEVYILKRKNLKKSFRSTTLRKILEFILSGTGISMVENIPEIEFSHFYFKNVTAASALQKIKDTYGLTMYFKEWKILFVGLANENDDTKVKYAFGKNVISNNLEWINEDDVRLKVKAVNVQKDNKKLTVEVGDADGETRTLFFYNLKNKAALKAKATEEMQKIKYSGYKGNMKTFLVPYVEVGNVAEIIDEDFPERSGKYLVVKVETKFDEAGAKRKIDLGIKVS